MKWKKQGLVYAPDGRFPWAKSHAHLPTPLLLNPETIRVYFAALDEQKFGRTTYVDVSAANPAEVIAAGPIVLDLGELGTFDDCGVVPSCAIWLHDRICLYYVGFQRCERVPYMLFSGLAQGDAGNGLFRRRASVPVLDRTPSEPFSRGAPFVVKEGDGFKMWYWSCIGWTKSAGRIHYNNVIRHATSADGVAWTVDKNICISPSGNDEFAIGRPCVIHQGDRYRMWYSIRKHSSGYIIGYAESADGIHWSRLDERAGIEKSDSGWDSEMICYPAILATRWGTYMFYNGNGHGATGFGYALLSDDEQ